MNKYMMMAAVFVFAGAMASEQQPTRFARVKTSVVNGLKSGYNNVTDNRVTNYVGQTRPYKLVANGCSKVKNGVVTGASKVKAGVVSMKNGVVTRWTNLNPKVKLGAKITAGALVTAGLAYVAKKGYDKYKTSKQVDNNNVELTEEVVTPDPTQVVAQTNEQIALKATIEALNFVGTKTK